MTMIGSGGRIIVQQDLKQRTMNGPLGETGLNVQLVVGMQEKR